MAHTKAQGSHPGTNVGIGRDDTLLPTAAGVVTFEWAKGGKKRISVYPPSSKK
jgi:large subunit ribosomal protein L27